MPKTNTMLLSAVILTLSLNSALAADPLPTTNLAPSSTQAIIGLLQACDKANEDAKKALSDKDALIAAQTASLEADAAELRKSNDKMDLRLLWFVAGMLTTALTVRMVK